jgi:hypothetical protein
VGHLPFIGVQRVGLECNAVSERVARDRVTKPADQAMVDGFHYLHRRHEVGDPGSRMTVASLLHVLVQAIQSNAGATKNQDGACIVSDHESCDDSSKSDNHESLGVSASAAR